MPAGKYKRRPRGRYASAETVVRDWPQVAAAFTARTGLPMTPAAAWATCRRAERKVRKILEGTGAADHA